MKFRNTLFMSIMLVVAFLCLDQYESKVREEYDAYEFVLDEMVYNQYNSIIGWIDVPMSSYDISDLEKVELKQIKSDLKKFKKSKRSSEVKSRDLIEHLFKTYCEKEKLKWNNKGISLVSEKQFYNQINKQTTELHKIVNDREILKRNNNVKIIIHEREEIYEVDKKYELDFLGVYKENFSLEEFKASYKIDGLENPIKYFPLEFANRPDSITFLVKGRDPVTGKIFNLKEKYQLNEKIYP